MTLNNVAQSNVVDAVFDELMRHIASGEWKIGEKIPSENELSAHLGVSRNSLRQALNRFNALGIIESRHGDGSYVRAVDLTFYLKNIFPLIILSKYDALNVYQLQKAIQCEAVSGNIMDLCTEKQLAELEERLEDMHACDAQDDQAGYLSADLRFHEIIVEMTRNPVLLSIEQCVAQLMRGPLSGIVFPALRQRSILAHEMMVIGFRNRNQNMVYQWMCAHMAETVNRMDPNTTS